MSQLKIISSSYTREFEEQVNEMLVDGWVVRKLSAVTVGDLDGGGMRSNEDLVPQYIAFMWKEE